MYSVNKIQVDFQAAIASRLAPTVDRVLLREILRRSLRYRWQASSYVWTRPHCLPAFKKPSPRCIYV